MAIRKKGPLGLTVVRNVAVLGAVSTVGMAGWLAYQHNGAKHSVSALSLSAANLPVQMATQSSSTSQPAYAAWPARANTAYGFSFNIPTDWTTSGDSAFDPKISATRQEFGTSLMPNAGTSAIEIEVLDEPLQTAEAWYDGFYAQTPIKVNKTNGTLKGKQSVQYDFVAPSYETKLYLFAVGSKTYLFSSVNESQNVSASANFWSNFDNIFNSLTIR